TLSRKPQGQRFSNHRKPRSATTNSSSNGGSANVSAIASERIVRLTIDGLSSEGQGVARQGRDVFFVPGSLLGEEVDVRLLERRKKIWHTRLVGVITESENRQVPPCPHYQHCGGCDLQHMNYLAQVQFKHDRVVRELAKQHITPQTWVSPLTAGEQHYRRKARLGVRFSNEQETNFVGFRESASKHLTDIDQCLVLPDHPALNWAAWRELIGTLDARQHITQIEPVWADNVLAFVLRVLKPLNKVDMNKLIERLDTWQSADPRRQLQLWLRTSKEGEPECVWPTTPSPLWHTVENMQINVQVDDFMQVHGGVNSLMVTQALAWLAPKSDEVIWDLFSGHGNFSLPIAQRCRELIAVEGQPAMTQSLQSQAEKLALPLQAITADLSQDGALRGLPAPDAILLDPPRAGASAVIPELIRRKIKRIVYVSCDAATLARDLNALSLGGYVTEQAGIMDMFPQTHHVETMVLLRFGGN
ncbi:MAG: hypothetical protein P1U57_09445, partial [Oleibacter sp.]|nr:hypothetical protein [Thalassolituus sp.]